MNKVLIATYYWPPGSGAGVQRWLKFAKYLPASGWEPIILTVDTEYAAYPAIDHSLHNEISGDLKIFRTRATDWFRIYKKDKTKIPSSGFATNDSNNFTGRIIRFIRGNFFIPDPRKGWNKFAFREACRLIDTFDIGTVITTSPPHSTQLIGLELKKKYPGIRWVADLRDPWTEIYYYESFYHTRCARKRDLKYETDVLQKADRVITVGKSLKNSFCARIPGIESKFEIITNGYDKADFPGTTTEKSDIFTISYIGTLSDSYPLSGFVEAFNKLLDTGFRIRLRFVGSVSSRQKELIMSKGAAFPVEFIPYVNHDDAVRYMTGSSVLLLVIPDHYSNRCILTGKLFEYIASSRPVLCIGPEVGDAEEILRITGHGKCAGYDDAEGIGKIIEDFYQSDKGIKMTAPPEYSRESLTKKLAAVLAENP